MSLEEGILLLEHYFRVTALLDFYGALLTDKQRQYLEYHFLNDLSLAEIAEEFGVSRQAVHDVLKRSESILEEYESRLGLVARNQAERMLVKEAVAKLDAYIAGLEQKPAALVSVRASLSGLLDEEDLPDDF